MLVALALTLAAISEGAPLANGGFEDKASGKEVIAGWVLELGAQNGATKPESKVELDKKEKHGGKACPRFSGNDATRGWLIAKQAIEVRPGGKYALEAWAKTEGVAPNGFGLDNCYVGLFFFDANESLVGRELAWPARPSADWTKHEIALTAAPNARTGYVYVFPCASSRLRAHRQPSTCGGPPLARRTRWRVEGAARIPRARR